MVKTENTSVSHSISMKNQTNLNITGVLEVVSATDKVVVCKLPNSYLQIGGENLRVEKLSPEDKMLIIVGTVLDIKYVGGQKGNFFKKLFR